MSEIPLYGRDGRLRTSAVVDECDVELVAGYRWYRHARSYIWTWARTEGGRESVMMHRLILGLRPGDIHVDHIDRDPSNNRRSNLRYATTAQNAQNQGSHGGSSPYRGVTWHKGRGCWQAQVKLDGRNHYLGLFADEEDASRAAVAFRAKQYAVRRSRMTLEDRINGYRQELLTIRRSWQWAFANGARCSGGRNHPALQQVLDREQQLQALILEHTP